MPCEPTTHAAQMKADNDILYVPYSRTDLEPEKVIWMGIRQLQSAISSRRKLSKSSNQNNTPLHIVALNQHHRGFSPSLPSLTTRVFFPYYV
jgi:hypothetical protein